MTNAKRSINHLLELKPETRFEGALIEALKEKQVEVAELMAQLKSRDDALTVAVNALEELSHDTDYAWGEREAQEALHSINTLLGREME